MVTPVPPGGAVVPVQGAVQDKSDGATDERFRREHHVDHIIELDISKRETSGVS